MTNVKLLAVTTWYVVECAEGCLDCTMSGKDKCDGPRCKGDYYKLL